MSNEKNSTAVFSPKIISSLKIYSGKQLTADLVAGLIVAIIALPLSIALAIASGVSPEKGLYTAIVAGFVIALFGGSRVNISGPTAAFATIVAGIVAQYKIEGLVIATIMAGILLIVMGLCRFGSLIKYIPNTITTGFTSGIAVTILIGQLKDFFGLTFAEGTHAVETMEKLSAVIASITTLNPWALLVGVVGLAVLIVWPKISKKIPGSLIAVLVGTALVALLNLQVNTIGDLYQISPSLPKLSVPSINWELVKELFPSAVTIAVLAAIESLLSCVVSDEMIGDRHHSNTELIAQGLGNICSGLFGGIPATGAIARTAANVKNGGRSPISGIVHAVVLLLVLVLLMPYAAWIPMPIIAAVLFIVAYNMSEWRHFVGICKTAPKSDILVLILTFVLTVAFDLVVAIAVGMVVHLLFGLFKKIKSRKEA
ncbi:MAG: sodium-independent anion transporter [Clostridia bacterium]|nr:sodium-independent anion transporter [Clostridia bacterium]